MTAPSPAERLLIDLGVQAPDEIDLEAIAWTLGVRVRYEKLDLCEARIVGSDANAIITVNNASSRGRQRFSLGHELGHWHYDRGKTLICQTQDIGNNFARVLNPKRVADAYAADLLMPRYLFNAALRAVPKITFSAIRHLATLFDVSLTAAAIRVAESPRCPTILVCHGPHGRLWFRRSPLVPERWFPQLVLDSQSPAFEVLFARKADTALP